MPNTSLDSVLGLVVTGDLGGMTYVQKGIQRRVVYAKVYPQKPPSPGQLAQRQKMAVAVQSWRDLTDTQRATMNRIVEAHNMIMSGFNLWIGLFLWHHEELAAEWAAGLGLDWV